MFKLHVEVINYTICLSVSVYLLHVEICRLEEQGHFPVFM